MDPPTVPCPYCASVLPASRQTTSMLVTIDVTTNERVRIRVSQYSTNASSG